MSSSPDAETTNGAEQSKNRDGRVFVLLTLGFLGLFVAFLLFVSPRLQEQLGLSGPLPFPTPQQTTEVALDGVPGLDAVAIWDSAGVCAEVTDAADTTFRTCATPDPLRPIWAIDAPDQADPGYLLVATPPDVANIEGITTDGETFAALTQARELPAAWALIPLPEGAVVDRMTAFTASANEAGDAECGGQDAPTDGPDRLAGGCVVPRQD